MSSYVSGSLASRLRRSSRVIPTALAAALLVMAAPALAQPAQNPNAQPGNQSAAKSTEETVTTQDGWRLPITYYPANDQEAPVAVLLHMRGDNRLVWGDRRNRFAGYLNSNGFAVITVDLRKHGEAKDPTGAGAGEAGDLSSRDYQGMYYDLEAVKEFIYEEHQDKKLNMAKTAIVAPGMTAPVALSFAAADWLKKPYNDAPTVAAGTPRGQDVKAIVLLSPENDLPGVPVPRAIRVLREPFVRISFLIVYATSADGDERAAKDLHRQIAGRKGELGETFLTPLETPKRGTDLIGGGLQIEKPIRDFLVDHTLKLDIPWRDRRSRLRR
jgi:alpha-beta hydrolase superfamily lysophospholipase